MGMAAIDSLWRKGHILARDEKLFRWQYERGREFGKLGFLIAEDAGEVVGLSGMIHLPWHIYGAPVPGGVGAITVMAPEYREAAHGIDMMAEVDEGLAVVGSFGINRRVARLYELQGRYVMRAFPRMLATGEPQILDNYLAAFAYPEKQGSAIRLNCDRFERRSLPAGYRVEKLCRDNLQEWDNAWRARFAPRLIGAGRPGEYVGWRYLAHPRYDYQCLIIRDNRGNMAGFAAYRMMRLAPDISAMRIMDFLANGEEAGRALSAALSEAVPSDCAYMEFFAPGAQGQGLANIGLRQEDRNLISVYTSPPDPAHCSILSALLVNLPDYNASSFATHKDIYFTLADGDQDRPN